MTRQLRAELLKLRTTRTTVTLLLSMLGLTALIVLLHALTIKTSSLSQAANQPHVFGRGTTIGVLFAALFGAFGFTGEIRHGTIRPTLLANPDRRVVVTAKTIFGALTGLAVGAVAEGLVAAIAAVAFAARGIPIRIDGGDFAQMMAGGAAAAALWGALGTGLGALVKSQVGVVIGLLLIENILIGNVPSVGRFAPAASAGALAGMTPDAGSVSLLAPAVGALLIVAYTALAGSAALAAVARRDVD
jgi:ABC-type transport system involved in multi-copper enzyme maturation permease subunit